MFSFTFLLFVFFFTVCYIFYILRFARKERQRDHLNIVVLAQVGWLQVEVAEGEPHVEAIGHGDVPVKTRFWRVRRGEVGRLQDAVRALRSQRGGDSVVVQQYRPVGGGCARLEEEKD